MSRAPGISRRQLFSGVTAAGFAAAASRPPNFALIYVDDLGYGDLGTFGHPTIRTPNLDRMAQEGAKFTSFYSTSALCTPSRAALLTGRYPVRSGLVRVLFPGEEFGIPDSEVTLGQVLQKRGYATACIGKWHLGDKPQHAPNKHGFDFFFGLHYSNDMDARYLNTYHWPYPPSLYRNQEKIETPVTQETMTERYNQEAVNFIRRNKDRPFLLYLPHSMVHWPWQASAKFRGKSRYGIYGDAVEEIDWGVGEILRTLRETGLERDTLVIFTSDNGGSIRPGGGSNGMLRGGKASMWEGGFREPFVARWPGRIPAGTVNLDMACTMDLFVTLLGLAGAAAPADRPIDGLDIRPMFTGGPSPRREFFYFNSDFESNAQILAIRSGDWKLHFKKGSGEFTPSALFDVERDPAESYDELRNQAGLAGSLRRRTEEFAASLQPAVPCPPLGREYRVTK